MNGSFKIKNAGKNAVTNYLISTGWELKKQDEDTNEDVDIVATKNGTVVIIKVLVAVLPEEPKSLSEAIMKKLIDKALKIGAKAYEAKVILDDELNPKKINFKKLK